MMDDTTYLDSCDYTAVGAVVLLTSLAFQATLQLSSCNCAALARPAQHDGLQTGGVCPTCQAVLTCLQARIIPHEEEVLHQHFGQEWEQYCKRTWCLIPVVSHVMIF